jgi:acetyl-CoA carboxylase biotin carboxyl carrier protein
LELKDIKIIIDLMKKNDLSVFLLEREGFKLKISRGGDAPGSYVFTPSAPAFGVPQPAPAPVGPSIAPVTPPPVSPEKSNLIDITSPMVGTFYHAMSPDSPPYIKVGQTVQPDTVVCIIEAMKVMNEIKSEVSGVVAEVLVENAKPVQFGQPLFRVRPA